jgi:hypothetical protein
MKTASKVSLYLAGLAVVFAGAWAIGAAVGPPAADPVPSMPHEMTQPR